jgi:hypothetical protein
MNDTQQLKTYFLDALTIGGRKGFSSTQQDNTNGLAGILIQKRLFSSSPLTQQPEVEPWLRSRLLESAVAYVGVLKYVDDLLSYDGEKPDREVRINGYLAAAHISFSLNHVVYDTLMKLRHDKRLNLTLNQIEDLSRVLNPSRTFLVPKLDQSFDPILVEDIRSSVQRLVWDELSIRKENLKSRTRNTAEGIPRDLVLLGMLPELTIKDLLDLSRQFSLFRITVKDGCLIWNFEGAPTMYIVDNKLFYSPSQSKGFTKAEIETQSTNIMRILKKVTERKPVCSICKVNEAQELAFTHDGTIIQVCKGCTRAPLVWRIIYSSDPGGVR